MNEPQVNMDELENDVIMVATLDRSVLCYWFTSVIFCLLLLFIGIPFIPFWLVFGWCLVKQYYATVKIRLTPRSLIVESGGICCHCVAHKVNTILLDRIQDIAMSQNCLSRCFGVETISIETAGNSGPNGGPELYFTGINDVKEFRDRVISARHAYVENQGAASDGLGLTMRSALGDSSGVNNQQGVELLGKIHDTLLRIESKGSMSEKEAIIDVKA